MICSEREREGERDLIAVSITSQVEKQAFERDLQPLLKAEGLQGSHFTQQTGEDAEGLACFYNTSSFKCLDEKHVCFADSLTENAGTLLQADCEPGETRQ